MKVWICICGCYWTESEFDARHHEDFLKRHPDGKKHKIKEMETEQTEVFRGTSGYKKYLVNK